MNKRLLVGIDPGSTTGFAMQLPDGKYFLYSCSFWEAIEKLSDIKNVWLTKSNFNLKVYIENPADK